MNAKEHPILFSGPMVQALLDGKKTMTRRPVKPQPQHMLIRGRQGRPGVPCKWYDADCVNPGVEVRCPYGAPGDRLWVREAFRAFPNGKVIFRASLPYGSLDCHFKPWKPGIHLPHQLHRIDLEVTAVRVERVQAITEEDAAREGFGKREHFLRAWSEMYGGPSEPFSVEADPWVWCVSFRRVEVSR